MSRRPIFATNREIATVLKSFAAGNELTYDHKQRLIASGHIVAEKSPEKRETRGRAKMVYSLSGKGKGLVALSKNWK